MSGSTLKGFSYPSGSDPVSIPSDIQALAEAAEAFIDGFTSTASSSTPIVLTVSSKCQQEITGSVAQTITAPVTSTLAKGWKYRIINNSSQSITFRSSGLNTIATIPAGYEYTFTVLLITGTAAASWDFKITGFATAPGATFVGCIAWSNTAQATTAGVGTVLIFESEEVDTHSFHDTTTNKGRMTIPSGKAGQYLLNFTGLINGAGSYLQLYFFKNGAAITNGIDGGQVWSVGVTSRRATISLTVVAAEGDYFEVLLGGDTAPNKDRGRFSITYLGG